MTITDDERVRVTLAVMLFPEPPSRFIEQADWWALQAPSSETSRDYAQAVQSERYCRVCAKIAEELGLSDLEEDTF